MFDTIKTWGKANYSSKVRRLGEFNPAAASAAAKKDLEGADIQDALYGESCTARAVPRAGSGRAGVQGRRPPERRGLGGAGVQHCFL